MLYLHLALITLAMCAAYFVLLRLFPFFFTQKITLSQGEPLSLALIIAFSVFFYAISFSLQDLEFGNRILHTFGGGFMGFLTCFFAARDSRANINKFQFFLFSALIVLALGIANELFELLLQEYGGFVFIQSVIDTWLDLASNVVGVIIAGACLVPFYKQVGLDHI